MDLNLEGKGVVITGGASNIGRALTLGFAAEGARVLIADVDEAQAEAVIADGPEGRITQRRTDVTNADEVTATIDHAIATLGGIDVLVNCAGWTVDRLFVDKPRAEWEREIAIDMWGFINATRAVLDHMIERGSGRIVTIGSDAGRVGESGEAVYSGSKAGVIAFSKALARELAKDVVTVNVVCPGFTPGTPEASGEHSIWQAEQGAQFSEETLEKVARSYPLRRLGTPEDVVAPVLAAGLGPRVVRHRPDPVGERRVHYGLSMRFANEISVDAQADELFAFVSDPEQVVQCLPGASVEGRDGDDWRGAMSMKVGPIKASYRGTLRFLELDPDARRAVMRVRAEEASGQGQAEARITSEIEEGDGASCIRMETDLQIRGKVAQFGRGAMEQVAGRMLERFADNVEKAIAGETPEAAADDEMGLPLPRIPSGVWWALAGSAVGFGAGFLIGRSQ